MYFLPTIIASKRGQEHGFYRGHQHLFGVDPSGMGRCPGMGIFK